MSSPKRLTTMLVTQNSISEQSAWFAVETRPRHEKAVSAALREKGFEHFLPLFSEKHQWSDRTRVVDMPVFPRYVFVRIEPTIDVRVPVLRIKGVMGFVGNRGLGAAIPLSQIENVRNIIANAVPFAPHAFLDVGQRVRILGGSLAGVEGVLAAINGDQSLVVSVELIRRSLAIRIEGYRVEPVAGSRRPSQTNTMPAAPDSSISAGIA